jgi:hypothetical protein
MDTIIIPTDEQIRDRIGSCEIELRALRRLLRVAQHARDAETARLLRQLYVTPPAKEAERD